MRAPQSISKLLRGGGGSLVPAAIPSPVPTPMDCIQFELWRWGILSVFIGHRNVTQGNLRSEKLPTL